MLDDCVAGPLAILSRMTTKTGSLPSLWFCLTPLSLFSDTTSMVISFVNDFAHLPADGSEHQPHVIDITAYDANTDDEEDAYDTSKPRKFRLWDAVATLLHTISPLQLRNFLDIDSYNREIKVELKAKNEEIRTVIWKKGMEILVSECFRALSKHMP